MSCDALLAAEPRQPKSCDGVISSDRASAEIFTPGSSEAAIARSLKASDHRRRSATGAPSSRSARTSTNWFGLVLRIGVDIDVDIHVRPLPCDRHRPRERLPLGAYGRALRTGIEGSDRMVCNEGAATTRPRKDLRELVEPFLERSSPCLLYTSPS